MHPLLFNYHLLLSPFSTSLHHDSFTSIVEPSIQPSNSLRAQELFKARGSVEPAEAASLVTAVGKDRLVVDGHGIDVDGPVE